MQIRTFIFLAWLATTPAFAAEAKHSRCKTEPVATIPANKAICFAGKTFKLHYDTAKRAVFLSAKGQNLRIETIKKGYEPELVDMVEYIRFLPLELQPYESRGVLLLNTATRSTGGNGGGQCGAGYELYLIAVNVAKWPYKVIGRFNIGSCLDSTFLFDMENGPDDYSSFSIQEGKLIIKFLAYQGKRGAPSAILSDDFRSLELVPAQESGP
ncbi:hypothetical protein [Pseudoduganella sp.]|uniref:hypothetical protein n=1 Tax=Pseudoduganella sp. TaxID=1880898 RepID=UPI0035B2A852